MSLRERERERKRGRDPLCTVVPLLRNHLQIQCNLVSEKRWSSKGGFMVCTVSASVQGNSGL